MMKPFPLLIIFKIRALVKLLISRPKPMSSKEIFILFVLFIA